MRNLTRFWMVVWLGCLFAWAIGLGWQFVVLAFAGQALCLISASHLSSRAGGEP